MLLYPSQASEILTGNTECKDIYNSIADKAAENIVDIKWCVLCRFVQVPERQISNKTHYHHVSNKSKNTLP